MSVVKLKQKCQEYLASCKTPTPRHFRAFYLKITKNDLYYLKIHKPNLYQVIIDCQDLILAILEMKLLWDEKSSKRDVGTMFILRSYDNDQYAPDIKKYDELLHKTPFVLNFKNSSPNKIIKEQKGNE